MLSVTASRSLGKSSQYAMKQRGTQIIKTLDREGLSVRKAHLLTGMAAADFSRIRNADLGRFTVDRLMATMNRLGWHIEVTMKVRRAG